MFGGRVEVGERLRDRAVTVTIKIALHAAMTGPGGSPAGNVLKMGTNYWPVDRPASGTRPMSCLCPCDTPVVSGRVMLRPQRSTAVCQFGG